MVTWLWKKIININEKYINVSGICLEKLSPFSDISQNSTLKNGLFTKFNMRKTDSSQSLIAFMFTFSEGAAPTPHFFRSQKCALPFFRSQK